MASGLLAHYARELQSHAIIADDAIRMLSLAMPFRFANRVEYAQWVKDLAYAARVGDVDGVKRLIAVYESLESVVCVLGEEWNGIETNEGGRTVEKEAKEVPTLRTHVCV